MYSSDGKVLHRLSAGYTVITSGKTHCLFFKVDRMLQTPEQRKETLAYKYIDE